MNELAHIGIYVKNLEQSIEFYSKLFGFKINRTIDTSTSKIAFIDIGKSLLELIQRPNAPGKAPQGFWNHIAIKLDNYDLVESNLMEMNIELRKVTLPNGKRIAFFKDHDGHDIEIME